MIEIILCHLFQDHAPISSMYVMCVQADSRSLKLNAWKQLAHEEGM